MIQLQCAKANQPVHMVCTIGFFGEVFHTSDVCQAKFDKDAVFAQFKADDDTPEDDLLVCTYTATGLFHRRSPVYLELSAYTASCSTGEGDFKLNSCIASTCIKF